MLVEVRGRNLRYLAPGGEFFGRDVAPILSPIACNPHLAIVRARPQRVHGLKRWGERINNAAQFVGAFGNERAHAGGHAGVLPRQVRTHGLPGIAPVDGLEKHVAREIQHVRVHRGEHQRLGAIGAVFRVAQRNRRNVLHFAGREMEFGNFGSAAAVDHVGIKGIGRDIAVLDHAHGMPIAEGDGAVVAAAQRAGRTALLLPPADAVGKRVRGNGMIELGRGLVIPGTPTRAPVDGDDCALIADNQNNVAVVGIDPKILVVVAAGRAAKSRPGFPAIGGTHGDGADHIEKVGILRIDLGNGKITAADASGRTRIIGDLRPGVPAIVGAIDAQFP